MKFSLIFNSTEGALVLKNHLESKGIHLSNSVIEEPTGLHSQCKFIFDPGTTDHKIIKQWLTEAELPITTIDSLREEITSVNEF